MRSQHTSSRRHLVLLLTGLLLLFVGWTYAWLRMARWQADNEWWRVAAVLLLMAAGGVYLAVIWRLQMMLASSRLLSVLLLTGVALRLLGLPQATGDETDYHRYLWDGALLAHGHSASTARFTTRSPKAVLPRWPSARIVRNSTRRF